MDFVFSRVKENVKNPGGARLNSNFECFTIGFHSLDGARSMDHFNFRADESRNNMVIAPSVLAKLKHSGDNKVVNVYQKPRELLNWMVEHFSRPKEWVMDLCAGSGTGLVSSLALGRHCTAVEIDERQSDVLNGRVLTLDEFVAGEDVQGQPLPAEPILGVGVLGVADQATERTFLGLDSQIDEEVAFT